MLLAQLGEFTEEPFEFARQVAWATNLLRHEHPIERVIAVGIRRAVANLFSERLADDRPRGQRRTLLCDDPIAAPPTKLLHRVHEREVPRTIARWQMGELREHPRRVSLGGGEVVDSRTSSAEMLPGDDRELLGDVVAEWLDELVRRHRSACVPDGSVGIANANVGQPRIECDDFPAGDLVHRGSESHARTVEIRVLHRLELTTGGFAAEVGGNDVCSQDVLQWKVRTADRIGNRVFCPPKKSTLTSTRFLPKYWGIRYTGCL